MDINEASNISKEQIERKIAELKWNNYRQSARECINPFVPHGTLSELNALRNLVRGKK